MMTTMVDIKYIGQFVGVSLPTLFLLLWSVDAVLMVGQDVFLIALVQFIVLAVFFWRYHEAPE